MEGNESDTSTQDLDEKNPSVPPSEEGMPTEEEASGDDVSSDDLSSDDLPGVPPEADEIRRERGDE